jgi:hypothetical protein
MKRTLPLLMCALCVCTLGLVGGCGGGSAPIVVAFPAGTAPMLDAGQSQNFTIMLTHDTKNLGVTWSLASAGTLSNATPTSVTYNAPAGPLTASVTDHLTATSVADKTKSVTVAIVITASLAIGTTSLPAGVEGTAYNQTVAVTGGAGTLTYAISVGALPAGLSLNGSTGAITGTPTGPNGTANFTVKVTDSNTGAGGPQSATKPLSITVNLPPAPSITTTSLPNATQGAAYGQTIAATGGLTPYTFSIVVPGTGTLPAGLTLSSAGVISGTPTGLGTSSFTVKLTDSSNPSQSATQNLSIKVVPAPVVITTTSLPNGIVNTPGYSATLTSTGGAPPITWSWAAQAGSTLPPGLVLGPTTGTISGTPTSAGTFNVTVTASDSSVPALTASKNLSITVIPQLVITTSSPLPNGITNTAYSDFLASTGGSGAIVWSLTSGSTLPANLGLNSANGQISGIPATAGTFNFTVQAADSGTPQQKVTKAFTLTIIQQLVITSPATPIGSVSTPFSMNLTSSGGTGAVTWALASGSTLPGGLTLTPTGLLSGTPTTAGTFNFSITATDSGTPPQTATKAFTMTITPKLAITTTSLPSGTVNTPYNTPVQTNGGGIAPVSWTWAAQAGSSLPPGLNIGSSTGSIFGTPTASGTFNVTVTATDSSTPTAQTASANLSISIATAPLSVATTTLPDGISGQPYSTTLQSAGGNPPVTWAISAGALPLWASLNATTGAITGTPTNTGTSTFTVKATDSSTPTPQTATRQLNLTVVTALSISTTQSQIPGGTVGSAYSATVTAVGGTASYTWSWAAQSGSSLPPGLSINSSTGAITGTPGGSGATYNVTVTVMDSGSPKQTASANFSITITVATLTVTTTSGSLPTGTVNSAYPNTSLAASGGIQPYTWAVTSAAGTFPTGLMLSSAGQITGTPTVSGTFNFTVTVTDSATPTAHTATANLSITVNAASACIGGSESLLSGGYAFLLKGFDSLGHPVLIGGVLTFNGTGGITAGTIDMNQNSGFTSNTVTSGSYNVGSDHRGCMAITTSAGTQNYRFSLGLITGTPAAAFTGHVIGFDTTGPFTAGVLRKQSSVVFNNALLNGSFAFGASSIQNSAFTSGGIAGGKFGIAGVITFNGSGGVAGSEDINQNGTLDGNGANTTWPASAISFNSTGSSYSIGSNGLGTLTVAIIGTTAIFHEELYVVSSSEVLFLASDVQTMNNIVAGEALQQSGTPFSANPLSGSYVGYDSGLGRTGTGRTDIYLLGPETSGSTALNFTQQRNDGGTFTSGAQAAATYSTSSTGRMLVLGTGGHAPVLYLVSASQAFLLTGNGSVDTGFFQSQSGSPFGITSASGMYSSGEIDPEVAGNGAQSGVATFTPATTTVSVTQDTNNNGILNPNQTMSFSYSIDTTGLGLVSPSGTSSCTISATATTCQVIFYVISPTKVVVMDAQSSSPKVQLGDK